MEPEAIEALKASSPDDVDLQNCCDFLLGIPTFVGITGDYARTTVAAALEAQSAKPAPEVPHGS